MNPANPRTTGPEPFLEVRELADCRGVPLTTIYDSRTNGRGPAAHRFDRNLMFAVSDVRARVDLQRDTAPGR